MSITTLSKNWILQISILIFLGLGAGSLSAQNPTLPIDFESSSFTYSPVGFGDASFNAIPTDIIVNPDMSAGNMSDSVWSITKTAGAQVWAGASLQMGDSIDLSMGTVITVNVWSPRAGVTIRLKTEDTDGPRDGNNNPTVFAEVDATTTMASAWETLTFDLATAATYDATKGYKNIVLFPDFNVMGGAADESFFFDDVMQVMSTTDPVLPSLPIDFEDPAITYSPEGFGDANFNAIPTDIIVNPDMSAGNMSDSVWMITKSAGAQVWAGASIILEDTIDLATSSKLSINVWSPRAGVTIRLKVEDKFGTLDGNGNPTIFSEVDATTTVASAWETLTFDLTTAPTYDASHSYNDIVLFPDFNVMGGAADESFFFDDIQKFEEVAPDPVKLPVTFESATADYAPAGFGDATTEVLDNPDMTGNTSAKVLRITKPSGAQTWAGVSIALDEVVDLSPGAVFSVDVWSPAAGTPILLKFEDTTSPPDGNGNPSIFSELQVSTTAAMSWETLSFDMSTAPTYDASHNYNQVVLFPNFGTSPGADETYYMDNILNVNAVSIDPDLFANAAFKLYPNPAKQDLNIDFNLPLSGDLSFEVMDMMGRVVKRVNVGLRVQGDHMERLQLNEIQSGAYLLLMKIDGDYVKQEKLIIQK